MLTIAEVFYQPGKLFASLGDRAAAWILPLAADIAVLVASTAAVVNLVGMETIVRQRLAGTNLSPEQMQRALDRVASSNAAYFSYAGAASTGILTVLVVAGLLMVFALMVEKKPKFSTVLAMVALAFLPYWLISGLMTTLVLVASPDRTALDLTNLLATNAGVFLNKETAGKGLYSVMSSIDLLSFLAIGMLGYGFSKVTRCSAGTGVGAVFILWVLFVFAKAAAASLF
ncbi:MAG TPA: YIP1 family protein [Bryobacteraceae bacterium]|nr:YIP1 family protein [Bryobacteraceae bacterium]